jgi:hypothetical protein
MKKIYFDCEIENVLKGDLYFKKINLSFTNNTDKNLIIGDPDCWINIEFKLYNNNREIPMLFKAKLNPECLKSELLLNPNQSIKIVFKKDLDQLFSLTKNNNYVLKVFYSGIISTDKGSIIKTNQTILTSTKEFNY